MPVEFKKINAAAALALSHEDFRELDRPGRSAA